MDNKVSKTSPDGKDSHKDKKVDTQDMPDKWCGNSGGVCREESHPSSAICAAASISKQAGLVYEGEYIQKTVDGV